MKDFGFKSSVCTSVEQSKHLLELGLKKETADMKLRWLYCYKGKDYYLPTLSEFDTHKDIPTWSLHRLIEIDNVGVIEFYNNDIPNIYDHMVNYIEKRIKMGLINPEYLEEKK